MKQTALRRDTPKSVAFARTRKAIKPFSPRTLALKGARRDCVAQVIDRDGGCVLPRRLENWRTEFGTDPARNMPTCGGSLTAHEPAKRSHGADPTNPDEAVALCAICHAWVHANPNAAHALGLLELRQPTHIRVLFPKAQAS